MRILKFLFSSIVLIAILAAVVFFVGREIMVLWATSTVKSSLTELQSISLNYGNYVRTCREKGSPPDQIAVSGLQLRFISNTEYLVELICTDLQYDPIIVEAKKLPPLVVKKPGSGGVIWGNDLSLVTLEVLGRSQTIGVQNKEITSSGSNVSTGLSPLTSCQGRGYACCNSDTQFGTGQIQNEVNDCPKSCYATCLPRPIVLSFSTDPLVDRETKTVSIGANQTVSFSFVISYDKPKTATVTLDYGDGSVDTFKTLSSKASHLYTCNTGVCNYQVHLTVTTTDQINSINNDLSQLTVNVRP